MLVLKNCGEIKLSGFDILKQNRNVSRVNYGNYIEDTQANNLQQFFLFGFSYSFNALNPKM